MSARDGRSELGLIADAARRRRVAMTRDVAVIRQEQRAAQARAQGRAAEATRARRQRAAEAAMSARVYAAAGFGRLNQDWVAAGWLSADAILRADLRTLKERARELRRDNPWVARYADVCVDSIIGPDGIDVQPQVLRADGRTLDDEANAKISAAWRDWCEHYASVDGRHTLLDLLRLAVELWKTEGEHLLQQVAGARNRGNPYGFALQTLDTDQLDERYNAPRGFGPGANEIRMGVEIDAWGAPVAYHLWTSHPSDMARDRMRLPVPAERILHLFRAERPWQTRGVTPLATVMQPLHSLGALQEAVLLLQRTAACKMGFLVSQEGAESLGDDDVSTDDESLENQDGNALGANRITWDADPGKIEQLPEGLDFKNWDPGQPGPEYDAFTKNVLGEVAAGLNLSYMSLTGDLSQTSFSSGRIGLLAERDGWKADQRFVIRQLVAPIYREWLKWALLGGALGLPYDARYFAPGAVHFQPRGFEYVDPAKEIDTALREVDACLDNLQDIAARKGRNFAANVAKRAAEIAMAAAAGVPINLMAKPAAGAPATDAIDATEASTEPSDTGDAAHANPRNGRALAAVG